MKKFLRNNEYLDTTTNMRKMINYRYVMTPRRSKTVSFTRQAAFAVKEHFRLMVKPNLSQFFVGSYVVSITQVNKEWADVDIYNETSRKSLFMHMPSSTEKPNMFGTVKQNFCLKVQLSDYQ